MGEGFENQCTSTSIWKFLTLSVDGSSREENGMLQVVGCRLRAKSLEPIAIRAEGGSGDLGISVLVLHPAAYRLGHVSDIFPGKAVQNAPPSVGETAVRVPGLVIKYGAACPGALIVAGHCRHVCD